MAGAAAPISSSALQQTDDSSALASSSSVEWYTLDAATEPAFQLQPHFHAQFQHFQQQQHHQLHPAGTLAMFHCPICLQIASHAPLRQPCGHALCVSCTRQALSMLGACPLCRTQLFFGNGSRMLQLAGESDTNDIEAPPAFSSLRIHASFDAPSSSTPQLRPRSSSAASPSLAFDASSLRREFHSDSELSLQLDNLSDFGDMIDLPELVANSDSEQRVVRRRGQQRPAAPRPSVRLGLAWEDGSMSHIVHRSPDVGLALALLPFQCS